MKIVKAIIGIVFLLFFLIFTIQNNTLVNFTFLTFKIKQVPLFAITIVIFIMGFILGRITGWFAYIFENRKSSSKKKSKE